MSRTRRATLAAVASGGVTTLAGCSVGDAILGDPAERLALSGEIQSGSTDRPPRLTLTVRNTGVIGVRVVFGPTPPFSRPFADSGDGPVVFDPEMGPNGDVPDTRTNGCWTVETTQFPIYDLANSRRIGGNGSVSNDYHLLTPAESDSPPCVPDGTYRYTDTVRIGGGERETQLAFELVVTDGRIDRFRNPTVSPTEPR